MAAAAARPWRGTGRPERLQLFEADLYDATFAPAIAGCQFVFLIATRFEHNSACSKLPPSKEHGNQAKPQESRAKPEMQKSGLQSNMGDEKYAEPVGQKAKLQSNKASLQSNKSDEKSASPKSASLYNKPEFPDS